MKHLEISNSKKNSVAHLNRFFAHASDFSSCGITFTAHPDILIWLQIIPQYSHKIWTS